jgi:predicted negative regulator of RcsB-dependent stress response
MTKPSAFDKKQIQTAVLGEKQSILDELHLPPEVVSFLRNNSKILITVALCVVLMIVGWSFYQNHTKSRNDKAAAALVAAMQVTEEAERTQRIDRVVNEFSGTDAAHWGRLELAHIDYQSDNFDSAAMKYKAVLDQLSADSGLVPLVVYSLGQAYEQLHDADNAIHYYQTLSQIPGFAGEGYLGLGRLYEEKNELEKARDVYEYYLALLNENPNANGTGKTRAMVEDKLATFPAGTGTGETE